MIIPDNLLTLLLIICFQDYIFFMKNESKIRFSTFDMEHSDLQ
jgi:hypothetical protein